MFNDFWMADRGFLAGTSYGDLRDVISHRFAEGAVVSVGPGRPAERRLRADAAVRRLATARPGRDARLSAFSTSRTCLLAVMADAGAFRRPVREFMTTRLQTVPPAGRVGGTFADFRRRARGHRGRRRRILRLDYPGGRGQLSAAPAVRPVEADKVEATHSAVSRRASHEYIRNLPRQSRRLAFGTRTIHAGQTPDPTTGAVMTPIYATQHLRAAVAGRPQGLRVQPHAESHAVRLRALRGRPGGRQGGLRLRLGAGGHRHRAGTARPRLARHRVRRSLRRLVSVVRAGPPPQRQSGFHATSIRRTWPLLEAAIRPNTRMIWMESPSNPLLKLADLAADRRAGQAAGAAVGGRQHVRLALLPAAADVGVRLVVHSVTKYLNGHSDMIGGMAVVGDNRGIGGAVAVPAERGGGHQRTVR